MTDLRSQLQSTLGDAYTIERELGGGGMSRVFLAQEHALKRKVVIKVLPSEATGALSVERFKREIQFAATLQQANIVPVLNAGETNGVPFYTMPYVEGESLRARLAVGGEFAVPEAIGLLKEIARALSHAHSKNVVHRDIKPDNVLLSGGSAMVTDFGIAKALSDSTTAGGGTLTGIGTTVGTPAYIAPEQASGDANIDHRADIYAFGCLAYEMLTGAPPFAGQSPQAVIAAHLTKEPEPVERKRDRLPRALASLVTRCLAKDPAARPQSAIELVYALDELSIPTPPNVPFSAARIRRGPFMAAAVFVVVGLVALAILPIMSSVKTSAPKSIAVLPFENAGGDTTQEYFAVGLSEDIASALVASGVRVAPMSSAASPLLRQPGVQTDSICRVLRVEAVVTGKATRLRNRLRVTVTLARPDSVLWLRTFEKETPDVLTVQQQMTDSIVSGLRERLRARATSVVARAEDPKVHDLIARGRFLLTLGTRAGVDASIRTFNEAIALDPENSRAHASLSWALQNLADGFEPPSKVIDKAHAAAQRAVELDSASGEAWASLAVLNAQYRWNWKEARLQAERALQLTPENPLAFAALAVHEFAKQRMDSTIANFRSALRSDPLNPVYPFFLMVSFAIDGQPDSALAAARAVQRVAPGFVYLDAFDGIAFTTLGRHAEADSTFRYIEMALGHPSPLHAWSLAKRGRNAEARAILANLERDWQKTYVAPELLAWAWNALGDRSKTYEWLEKGIDSRSAAALFNLLWPEFQPLRNEARFAEVLRRMNLTLQGIP